MQSLLFKFATLLTGLTLVLCIAAPAAYAFDPFGDACDSGGSASAVCQDKGTGANNPLTGQNGLLRGISGVLAFVTGIAAVIIIIIAGFQFVTAGGDAAKAKSAREAIVAALVGLVIILMADAIISFVVSRL